MGVADALSGLGVTDPPPRVIDMGGEQALREELVDLDAELLPRLVEAVAGDWDSIGDPVGLVVTLAGRLPEVDGPLSFGTTTDFLLAVAAKLGDGEAARVLMDALLAVTADVESGPEHALRAGQAFRAAVDLALLDAGVSAHQVLAAVERLEAVPPEMASSTARALGRLWEHYDEPFLGEKLESQVLPHDDAAGDGAVELGLKQLRDAFGAGDREAAAVALAGAVRLFDDAAACDENRPDARAYAAGARAVLAFDARDESGLDTALGELADARSELDRYAAGIPDDFHGAEPLRSVSAWHVLAARLRVLRDHLKEPDLLNLRPAVEALADAYGGMRLAVLDDERVGFHAFIRPVLVEDVGANANLAGAMAQLGEEDSSPASELAGEVVRPKARTPRSQSRPAHRRPPRDR